jgi:hypothetical protein
MGVEIGVKADALADPDTAAPADDDATEPPKEKPPTAALIPINSPPVIVPCHASTADAMTMAVAIVICPRLLDRLLFIACLSL